MPTTSVIAKRPRLRELFTIIAVPSVDARGNRLHDRFDAHLVDRLLVAATRQPLLDGARALLELGADPAAIAVMKHAGSNTECLRSTTGAAARLTVVERDRGNIHLERWKPYRSSAVEAGAEPAVVTAGPPPTPPVGWPYCRRVTCPGPGHTRPEAGVEAEEVTAPPRQKRKRYQQVCRGSARR